MFFKQGMKINLFLFLLLCFFFPLPEFLIILLAFIRNQILIENLEMLYDEIFNPCPQKIEEKIVILQSYK